MNLTRATDATRINEIVNDPSIYPFVKGATEGPLDLTIPLSDPRNIALLGKWGGVILAQQQAGIYELHVQSLPEGRGAWTAEMAQSALSWAFTHTEAVEIFIRAPRGLDANRDLARAIGAHHQFRAERGWILDGEIVPADIYSLVIQDWMASAPDLIEVGKRFHDGLDAEYRRVAIDRPERHEDEARDRYVGAAVEMIRNGHPDKGAIFYNRFAGMANCTPIAIVNRDPVMVDMGDCILELHGRNFFIASVASGTEH